MKLRAHTPFEPDICVRWCTYNLIRVQIKKVFFLFGPATKRFFAAPQP